MRTYYEKVFQDMIEAGVPKSYIRLYLIDDLIYFSRLYVFFNPYDIETENGWYATNGIGISYDTEADKKRKCYGDLKNMGFPFWEEYRMLFEGDEYDSTIEFIDAYVEHKHDWIHDWIAAPADERNAVY